MDSFNLSLDQLAKETFELGQQLTFENFERPSDLAMPIKKQGLSLWDAIENESIQESSPAAPELPIEEKPTFIEIEQSAVEEIIIPQAPGIVYKVEKTSGTFCIRAFASGNLNEDYIQLLEGDEILLKKLKSTEISIEDLLFFETNSMERAEIIIDQVANRRFPLDEDVLCNLSDPGFSWWMSLENGSFKIYFNSHGLNRADRFMQLGPLGDGSIAALRFHQLRSSLENLFPIHDFKISDKYIHISTSALDSREFYRFQAIFTDGINDTDLEQFEFAGEKSRTIFYYLKEIADLRRFWLQVEQSVKICNLD